MPHMRYLGPPAVRPRRFSLGPFLEALWRERPCGVVGPTSQTWVYWRTLQICELWGNNWYVPGFSEFCPLLRVALTAEKPLWLEPVDLSPVEQVAEFAANVLPRPGQPLAPRPQWKSIVRQADEVVVCTQRCHVKSHKYVQQRRCLRQMYTCVHEQVADFTDRKLNQWFCYYADCFAECGRQIGEMAGVAEKVLNKIATGHDPAHYYADELQLDFLYSSFSTAYAELVSDVSCRLDDMCRWTFRLQDLRSRLGRGYVAFCNHHNGIDDEDKQFDDELFGKTRCDDASFLVDNIGPGEILRFFEPSMDSVNLAQHYIAVLIGVIRETKNILGVEHLIRYSI